MQYTEKDIWTLLEQVADPEVPVLTVVDLGIIRGVVVGEDKVSIDITPTYTGCPAMNTIERDIRILMSSHHIPVEIKEVLSPAWTTDWMSESGKQKLKAYGIAPPQYEGNQDALFSTPQGIV